MIHQDIVTSGPRHWVRHGGRGGRQALVKRFDDAIDAIPGSLHLTEGT